VVPIAMITSAEPDTYANEMGEQQ